MDSTMAMILFEWKRIRWSLLAACGILVLLFAAAGLWPGEKSMRLVGIVIVAVPALLVPALFGSLAADRGEWPFLLGLPYPASKLFLLRLLLRVLILLPAVSLFSLTGVLLLDYLIGAMKRSGKMPANPVALKTIVTTEMARKVAESNGVKCFDTFTGFKFMAEKKNALEESGEGKVIFSYEESYGYMLGDYVRDKDAVTASMLLTEMAAWYDAQGMTLFDALNALYEKYGYYAEKTHNLVMPGLDGLRDMAKLMADLRANPPTEISGVKVTVRKDYTDGSVIDCATGAKSRMELSGSNVLRYELADGTVILVRPSGTEPKIKVYILTQGADAAEAAANIEKYGRWVAALKP